MLVVKKMLSMHVKNPSKLPIMFELTQEARDSNMKLLKEINYDIEELISRFKQMKWDMAVNSALLSH